MSYKPFTPSLLNGASQEAPSQLASWRLGGLAVLRIAFGCIWAIDAWFKWQPGFADNFTGYLTKALDGQPPVVATWINFWIHVVSVNPHLFAFLVTLAETGIAMGLLFGALSNLTCLVGILLSLSIWSTAQGFGGPYGPGSTDIGVSIIYVLVFTGLFLGNAGLTFGVDRYLASGLGKWNFLASGLPFISAERLSISIEQQRKQFIHPAPIPMGFPQMVAYRVTNRQRVEAEVEWMQGEDPYGHPVLSYHQPVEQLRRLRAVDDVAYQDGPGPVANGSAASNSRLVTIKGQRLSRM